MAEGRADWMQRTKGDARPRSEREILDAAYSLALTEGLKAATVEAIAKKAGVSKVTIYKWWPTRAAVIMSAFLEHGTLALPYPDPMTPDSIVVQLKKMAEEFHGPTGRMISALLAESQHDPEIKEAFRVGYIGARRAQGTALIQSAMRAGILRPVDPNVVLDLMFAPLYFRLLVEHGPLDEDYVREHVDLLWNGIARGAEAEERERE